MQIVETVAALRTAVADARARGERIGFVPTMGALHEGHLSLIDHARAQCASVVLSIFVNPLQFAPTDDLATYPRTESADIALATTRGATIAFVPSVDVMYPGPRVVSVIPDAIADRWEGAIRPGHFAGVLTVVSKLFNLVQPDVAVFGQKDLQQATLLRALVRDLDFPITLQVAPIVREADGLAMSSRNRYLGEDDRRAALALSRALSAMSGHFLSGVRNSTELCATGDAQLRLDSGVRRDYLSIVDPVMLAPVDTASVGDYVILAARVGGTRLLDNHRLGEPFPVLR